MSSQRHTLLSLFALLCVCVGTSVCGQAPADAPAKPPPPKAYADPAHTDDDFPIQGEYRGEHDGRSAGVQVMALGGGKFEAVGYPGGLPGDGWDGEREKIRRVTAERSSGAATVTFTSHDGSLRAEVGNQTLLLFDSQGLKLAEFPRVERVSPTIDAPPPAGAVVLFDGKGINRFPKSRVTDDGLLMEGVTSEDKFKDCTVHIEFRLPYMPDARGQGRGNSGIYLQGRYEVQMLDSFSLSGEDNECGGLYKTARPGVNMCFPPLAWQTYDIDFTAAKFDAQGAKTANAKMTVKHNGVVIHENQEVPKLTNAAPVKAEEDTPGPIYLQNHGNPVRYRNIWVLPK
jgi:hypothetical protein